MFRAGHYRSLASKSSSEDSLVKSRLAGRVHYIDAFDDSAATETSSHDRPAVRYDSDINLGGPSSIVDALWSEATPAGRMDSRPAGGGIMRPRFRRNAMPADCTTLMLRNIPEELNTVKSLSEHFSQFGTLQHVRIAFDDDPTSALIAFENPQAAQRAYASEQPVFNNRFIRVFWHMPDEDKLRQAAEMLRDADVDMEKDETAVEEDETQVPTPRYPTRDIYTKFYGKLAEATLTPSAASSPTHDERSVIARDVKLFQAKCRLYLEKSEEGKQRLIDLKSCSDGGSNKVLLHTVENIEKLLDTLRPQIADLHASIMERAKELPAAPTETDLVDDINKILSGTNSSAPAPAPSSDYSSFYSGSNGPTSPEDDGDDEGISILV